MVVVVAISCECGTKDSHYQSSHFLVVTYLNTFLLGLRYEFESGGGQG